MVAKKSKEVKPVPIEQAENILTEGKEHHKETEKLDKRTAKLTTAKINKYGFMRFSNELLKELSWPLKEEIFVKVTIMGNGVLVERA